MPLIEALEALFASHAHVHNAQQMAAYMKQVSPYIGLKKPLRAQLQKQVFAQYPIADEQQLIAYVHRLWSKTEREYQYAALDLLLAHKKLWSPHLFELFEQLVAIKPWWDTIDTLAVNCVGALIQKYPALQVHMDRWITDPLFWKRRVALLYQLRYKQKTDTKILARYCTQTMHEREFFIAKAIGWALREYSKTDPTWVRAFLTHHADQLARLSMREAGKYC
ncbi:MAG: DNA alkylation repair protein [Candidatus Babeliales bacterium]